MPKNHKLEQFLNGSLLEVRGEATWNYQSNTNCDLSESKIIKELMIGSTVATRFTAADDGFHNWEERTESGNHLSILVPCWAYILSKFLVEAQGCAMEYTDSLASWVHDKTDSSLHYRVAIGDASFKEARWWRAILAPAQDWRSIMRVSSDLIYLAPWSIEYCGDFQFFVETSVKFPYSDDNQNQSPPSSEEALQYLTSYCLLHGLGTQYFAALSAALILPLQKLLCRTVRLPKPVMIQRSWKPSSLPDVQQQLLNLPYIVTVSCAIRVLSSALWAVFWEPGIDCNLASAWLFPASKVIVPLIETRNQELLVKVLARHEPIIGPLWFGAILTGFSTEIAHFLRTLQAPYARPESLASAWFELPQLFLDTPGFEAYRCDGDRIRRVDRWRLLHDVGLEPYCSTPLSSWQPFGWMPLSSVELDVMAHMECRRHQRKYIRWNWFGKCNTELLGEERAFDDNIADRVGLFLMKCAAVIHFRLQDFMIGCLNRKSV